MSNQQNHIALINIVPSENKWRSYNILVIANEKGWRVNCAWGRMNRYCVNQMNDFEDEKTACKFLESILKRRYQNGYKIVHKSEDFPKLATIEKFEYAKNYSYQLSLF